MQGHAGCVIAYGIEGVVPFWKFINSQGKQPPTKGLGRILPQNIIYLIAPLPGHLLIDGPAPKRRKRMESISKADIDARLLKKEKLDHNNVMDQDNVLPH